MEKESYEIDFKTYLEDSSIEYFPWDEEFDSILLSWGSERFYNANKKKWNQ